jgi:hypothetical protein
VVWSDEIVAVRLDEGHEQVLGRRRPARRGPAVYSGWLDARTPEFRAQTRSAALDAAALTLLGWVVVPLAAAAVARRQRSA